MTVAMNLATTQQHSFMKSAVVDVGVQVGSLLRIDYDLSSAENEKSDGASDETSSVIEYMSPAPAVPVAPPDPVIEYVVPTPTVLVVEHVTPVPVPDFVTPPAHVIQYVAPLTNSQCSSGLVNPQFSTFAVEASASQVVGLFPAVNESASPVFEQVCQQQIGADPGSLSVRNSAPVKTLYTCPSLRSRCSL